VSDLLSLACIEDKDNELICSVFDVGGAVSDAVSEMEQLAREKGLSIQMRIEPGVNVKSDRASVGKILAILLDNAIKYTDEGGEITVDVSREKSGAVCAVKNSGGGVPEEELPRLFDRFYRGDPARSDENRGSGLGLSIAAAAAERLGASLTAASVPGQYTELRLTM
jgi:signal transduction histidine kinase